jgi:hypothetical protein
VPGARARLASLDARVSRLEALSRGDQGACAASLTAPEVRDELAAGTLSGSARGVVLTEVRPWLERWYNAKAFLAGGPEPCAELAPLGSLVKRETDAGEVPFDLLCKTNYYEALMARTTIDKKPGIFELCRLRNLVGDRDFKLSSLDRSCRIIADHKGTVDDVCESLTPYFDNASIAKTCRRMLRYVSGDASVCAEFSDELVHERCSGYAAYARERAGDAGACGDEPQCWIIDGRAAEAEARAERGVVEAACRAGARPEILSERARDAADDAAALVARLAATEPDAPDRSAARDLDALVERAARLEARARALTPTVRR